MRSDSPQTRHPATAAPPAEASGSRRTEILLGAAIGLVLATGLVLRAWGGVFAPLDLWADEAWAANRLIEFALTEHGTRPIGYMAVSRVLLHLAPPDVALRLVSFLASVGTLLAVVVAAKLLFRNRIAVLFVVLTLALHPTLIVFAKEFKPYSLETFVHSGLLAAALVSLRGSRTTARFRSAAALSLLFCYNVIFLYPSLLLAGRAATGGDGPRLLRAFWRLSKSRKALWMAGALGTAAVVNLLVFDLSGAAGRRAFWGEKYGVFPLDLGAGGTLAWYLEKSWDLLALPGDLHAVHAGVEPILGVFFAAAWMAGVVAMLRARRHVELGLLGGALGVTLLANILGYWPYGAFRTNIFLIPALVLTAGCGFDWLASRWPSGGYGVFAAFALVALPLDPGYFGLKRVEHWAPSPQLTHVLDDVQVRHRAGGGHAHEVILADWHSWHPLRHYLTDDPRARETYSDVRENVRLVRGTLDELAALEAQLSAEHSLAVVSGESRRVWLVVTNLVELDGIRANPLVREFGTYQTEFATHDPGYHPLLLELLFPGGGERQLPRGGS